MAKALPPDNLWAVIVPLLPPSRSRPKGGRPPMDTSKYPFRAGWCRDSLLLLLLALGEARMGQPGFFDLDERYQRLSESFGMRNSTVPARVCQSRSR
jgi:hypothetical protein